jgi:hypothetical protein
VAATTLRNLARIADRAPIYRAPMRSRTLERPAGVGAEYGLEHGVVGIGPGEGAKAERMLRAFGELPDGTFVWTRDTDGLYHLGRIAGPLREDDAAAREVGLPYVRAADWLEQPFGPDDVPADVAATFARGGRNLQRTHSESAERRTARLWGSRR